MVFSEGEECDVQGWTEGGLQRWQSFVFCTVLWTCNNIFQYFSLSGPRHFCGEGNGTPLQYSCLENPMDRGAW